MRYPDYQKREAKRSLWDQDGQHSTGRDCIRGRARNQDKQLIRYQLLEDMNETELCEQSGEGLQFRD